MTRRLVQMPIDWAILRMFRARLIDVDTCVICAREWRVSFVLKNFIVRVRFAFIESPDVRFRSIGFVLKRSTPHVLDHILAVCPNFRAFLARSSTGIYTTRVHVHSSTPRIRPEIGFGAPHPFTVRKIIILTRFIHRICRARTNGHRLNLPRVVITHVRVFFVTIRMHSPFADVFIALVKAILGVEVRLTTGGHRGETTIDDVHAQPVVVLITV